MSAQNNTPLPPDIELKFQMHAMTNMLERMNFMMGNVCDRLEKVGKHGIFCFCFYSSLQFRSYFGQIRLLLARLSSQFCWCLFSGFYCFLSHIYIFELSC